MSKNTPNVWQLAGMPLLTCYFNLPQESVKVFFSASWVYLHLYSLKLLGPIIVVAAFSEIGAEDKIHQFKLSRIYLIAQIPHYGWMA